MIRVSFAPTLNQTQTQTVTVSLQCIGVVVNETNVWQRDNCAVIWRHKSLRSSTSEWWIYIWRRRHMGSGQEEGGNHLYVRQTLVTSGQTLPSSLTFRASDLKIGTPVATLPGAWRYRVSTGTGWPGVSILWLGEVERLICNISVWQHVQLSEQIRPWDTLACCWDVKQPTNTQSIKTRKGFLHVVVD